MPGVSVIEQTDYVRMSDNSSSGGPNSIDGNKRPYYLECKAEHNSSVLELVTGISKVLTMGVLLTEIHTTQGEFLHLKY